MVWVKKRLPARIRLFRSETTYHVNPTGTFVIGGPQRYRPHRPKDRRGHLRRQRGTRGGAFSGKDPSKGGPQRGMHTRHIAKHLAAGVCDECLVQVAYAIGVAKPVGLCA